MIKIIFIILLIPLASVAADFTKIQNQSREMLNLIREAKSCITKKMDDGVLLCTGVVMTDRDFERFKSMDRNRCEKFINKLGFELISNQLTKKLNQEELDQFRNSTKRAQIFWDKKYVALKDNATREDCLHEIVHIYQRHRPNESPLNPVMRKKRELEMLSEIEKVVAEVEALEKKGDKVKAKDLAAKIQPIITLLAEWRKMINWLDEKEVYHLFFQYCDRFKCGVESKDISLANLLRLKEYFDWREREIIESLARAEISKKEEQYFKSVKKKWKKLDDSYSYAITPVLTLDKEKLVERINTSGNVFLRMTKDKEQTICQGNKLFVSLPEDIGRIEFLLTWMKYLQLKRNPEFCQAHRPTSYWTNKLTSGEIDRATYDREVLTARMMKLVALQESLSLFKKQVKGLSVDLFRDYKKRKWLLDARLSFNKKIVPRPHFKRDTGLSFTEKDGLPRIDVMGMPAVFDTGAQKSILPFSSSLISKTGTAYKTTTLATADGKRVDSPIVHFKSKITIAGEKISDTRWALADLKLRGVDAILGLDQFENNDIEIDLKKNIVTVTRFKRRPEKYLELQKNSLGKVDALEILCPNGMVARLDTGSQVEGDVSMGGLNWELVKDLKSGKAVPCGHLSIKGKFEFHRDNPVLFSRDVGLNLGWPWLKQFKKVKISTGGAWIAIEE